MDEEEESSGRCREYKFLGLACCTLHEDRSNACRPACAAAAGHLSPLCRRDSLA